MNDDDELWRWSAAASAEILNLHYNLDLPKCEIFRRIQFSVYGAMRLAVDERPPKTVTFSDN